MILAPVIAQRKASRSSCSTSCARRASARARRRESARARRARACEEREALGDVVIDRLRVRADTKQRLANPSRPRCGTRRARPGGETDSIGNIFSRQVFVPAIDYALPELEPRLSRSTTRWAPARAARPGRSSFFDRRRLAHPNLSLASARSAAGTAGTILYSMLQSLAGTTLRRPSKPWELPTKKCSS